MTAPETILAIDTSAAACSVALVRGGETLVKDQKLIGRGQAELLLPMVDDALKQTSLDYAALTKIAVIIGPGAYTGVRIGVSAARGFAVALGIPCVGVSSLTLIAEQAMGGSILATVAGRGETLFVQSFTREDGALREVSDAASVTIDRAKTLAKDADFVVGSGRVQLGLDEEISLDHLVDPAVLAHVAATLDPAHNPPEPLYLREADAIAAKPVFERAGI